MAYSPDFLHDIFISYASDDEATDQLISFFADLLQKNLASQGVSEGVSIFLDKTRLESGSSLSNQILAGAESTAVMVAFHSPAYDASVDWCHREYREFADRNPKLDGRFFLIALEGSKLPSKSPVFTGADRHFRSFFTEKKGEWFRFTPSRREDYVNVEGFTLKQEVELLAKQMARTLERLRSDSLKKRVFLTATKAFEDSAKGLHDSLTDCDFVVLKSSPWLKDKETRLNSASMGISRADLVISILENFSDAAQSEQAVHATEQMEIAARLQKPTLQWLPSENHGFSQEEMAVLKTKAEVIATSLEEFKKIVVARLTGPERPLGAPSPTVSGADRFAVPPPFPLFISASDDAKGALADLVMRTKAMEIGYDGRVDGSVSNDPAAIETWCRQIKESIAKFHHTAVIFIDGLCPPEWIDTRLRSYLVLERDLPSTPKAAVCNCPPMPKRDLRLFGPPPGRVTFLPCEDDAALREFLLR